MSEPKTIAEWIVAAWQVSKDHGFHNVEGDGTPARLPERVALLHSEASELLEAYRKGYPARPCDKPIPLSQIAEELADIAIRLFDFAGEFHIEPIDTHLTLTDIIQRQETRYMPPSTRIAELHKFFTMLWEMPEPLTWTRTFARVLRFAAQENIDLEHAILTKHAYNEKRPHLHGKAF
jgi:NTP pyrophosphatase (non-canonical NTP hydrolase)